VDKSQLFSAKEDKVGSISRKGHGMCIGMLKAFGLLIVLKRVKQ
jgi:tetrahydromethanopterin S-methyltransferase subunit F